jgi:hypothetical protein
LLFFFGSQRGVDFRTDKETEAESLFPQRRFSRKPEIFKQEREEKMNQNNAAGC